MSKTVGEYQLKEKIGKGSYADVYKGTHKITGLKYAIKTISKDILSEPKLLAGLESEIKIMREFVHPNIVCLHEYFSSEKNFYLILELCEGGDLSKFIKKRKRIDERLAHNFLTQITSGLAFLHEKNFIHRDLKPANVLLSEFSDNAVLKLADFGFARQLTVASLAQTRCGTPLYMAPEILESKDYDGKADIWSVGCIFYEMLVGTSPFKGANEGDLLMNIKTKELNVPNDVVLSEVSLQILIKLLERYPLRRAALPQLVALCAHITSNPPPLPAGSSSSGAGGEETGLALPIPSPTSAENRSGGDMHQSARGRTPEGPTSAEPRRRSSTSSIPGDGAQNTANNSNEVPFISPVKAPTREYPGGPAVGNLRGMFAPGGDGNPHTPPPPAPSAYPDRNSNTYSPSHQHQQYQSHQDSQQQNAQGQGHARRPSGTHYDPQVSKTVRAPYANPNNPLPHKYPSPSSSPPNSSGSNNITSGAGFSMQTTTHNNNNTNTNSVARSAPTGSVASSPGTIGMMGNLIAYVFNPSPSPPSVMSESARAHAQMKHQQAHQQQQQQGHGRSVSLDRATPPNFGNNNNFGVPFGNGGGGGTPPPAGSSRARQQSAQGPQYTQNTTNTANTANNAQSAGYVQGANRVVREDHFAFAEQDSLYSAARDNAHNNYNSNNYNNSYNNNNNNSSSNLSDEDFVMIDKSATERNDARTPTNPNSNTNNNTINNQHYQYPHGNQSQSNSQSTSSYSGNSGGNSGNNSTGLMGVVPPPAPTQSQPRAAYDTNTNTNPNYPINANYPTNTNNTSPQHYQQQQQQQLQQQQQSYHLEREVRTHESAAMHAFYASIVQRCEVCCAVVAAVSALGDQHVRETLSPQGSEKLRKTRSRGGSMDVNSTNNTNHTNNENGTESEDEDGIAGFLQQPGSHDSRASHTHSMQSMSSNHSAYFSHHAHHAAKPQQAVVDRYLTACSLYLHALSILANLLRSFDGSVGSVGAGNNGNNGNNNTGGEQAEPMRGVMQKLKADVTTVFEQLIARAEGCQKHIDSLVNPTQSASVHALSASKYTLPQAEPVMVQAALRRESDAAMEELLGNLNLASKLYASANELIEGVALTAHDPEDQRKLHLYSASLLDKHHSCRRRAEELGVFS